MSRTTRHRPSHIIEPNHYPFRTFAGVKHRPTVTDADPTYGCRNCPHLEQCRETVTAHDGYAFCEPVMAYELIPASAYMEVHNG